jgi:hypothetical protein
MDCGQSKKCVLFWFKHSEIEGMVVKACLYQAKVVEDNLMLHNMIASRYPEDQLRVRKFDCENNGFATSRR